MDSHNAPPSTGLGPYLRLARNVGILLLVIFTVAFFYHRDHEKRFPQKELSNFERSYFEPVVARNYQRLQGTRYRGRHVLLLVPTRWSPQRKPAVHSDQNSLPPKIRAKSFAEADTIFFIHEGEKVTVEKYTSKDKVKDIRVRTPFIEILAFDRSGKCLGFSDAYAEKPEAALVFTKEGDKSPPEILASFSFSLVHYVSQTLGEINR